MELDIYFKQKGSKNSTVKEENYQKQEEENFPNQREERGNKELKK